MQLIPLSEDVITLKSVCMSCYRAEASFSYRINTDNREVSNVTCWYGLHHLMSSLSFNQALTSYCSGIHKLLHFQVEFVGGPEEYKALCRSCYMNHTATDSETSISNGA